MSELATLSKNGFTMFQNLPMSEFLTQTMMNVGKGFELFPNALLSFNGGGKAGLAQLIRLKQGER